jgi:hypothetical protein
MKLDTLLEFQDLDEATVFPEDVTISEVMKMFDGAKKAVGLMNKLKNPADRKRHASAIFKNLNRIRAMIMKLTEPVEE